ncbi:MAG: DegV family protein [Firmicutes bacterium]|nr:DegV family protein [Bacillota bacterium]
MNLKIITDSACDLPEELVKEYDVDVLPFLVYIDDNEYLDGHTIKPAQVYDAMRAGKVPTTAQVPLDLIISTFTKYAKENRPCLYIGFSSKLSGTCNTVRLVTQEIQAKYPEWEVTIVDCLGGCLAQGLIVLEAAQMAKAGAPHPDIIQRVKARSKNNVEHVFSVDDLNYLYRGGRVSYASAFLGGILSVKPILHVKDGLMIPFQKVRGKKNAIKRIGELVQERSLGHPDQLIAISHADDPDTAAELKDLLQSTLGYKNFLVNVVGSVLGCHIGLGGVAAFFVNAQVPEPNLPY